jgi:hypothetical protein
MLCLVASRRAGQSRVVSLVETDGSLPHYGNRASSWVSSSRSRATRRQVWKYKKAGRGRFALRIALTDDVVTGWESKGQ